MSTSPESTTLTIASTSDFVPTTSSMVTTTRPSIGPPTPFQSAAESSRRESEGLGAAATGGLSAGITVVGIAVIGLIVWFIIRKRRRAAQTGDASVVLSSQSDNPNRKTNYHHHSHQPAHELPGDDAPTMNSLARNHMEELDSVRPASELDFTRPMSELSSSQTDHDRWSANATMPTSPSSLPDVQEDEEMASMSQPGRFSHIRTAKASRSHRRFSSV
jgi:hypothetical protein